MIIMKNDRGSKGKYTPWIPRQIVSTMSKVCEDSCIKEPHEMSNYMNFT